MCANRLGLRALSENLHLFCIRHTALLYRSLTSCDKLGSAMSLVKIKSAMLGKPRSRGELIADVLELDPERTPATLLDFMLLDLTRTRPEDTAIGAAEVKSAEEWAKHRAILGYKISPEEIRIEARCSHPAIQKGLREWCAYIDAERRECRVVARDNTEEITRKVPSISRSTSERERTTSSLTALVSIQISSFNSITIASYRS